MSQAGLVSAQTSPLPDVETLTGNTGGPVGPDAAFNINIVGTEEIIVTGNPATNTLTIDSLHGTGNTVGAVTADLITLPLGATPAGYAIQVLIAGFDITTPSASTYEMIGTVRTTGIAAFKDQTEDFTDVESAAMAPGCNEDLLVAANNAIVRVTGGAGLTIHWKAKMIYTKVT